MASGDGVTMTDLGGARWRLRWRTKDDAGAWKSREKVIEGTELDAEELAVRIRKIRAQTFQRGPEPRDLDEVIHGPVPPANLAEGFQAFIDSREAAGRFKPKSVSTYTSYMLRILGHVHAIHKIPEGEPLPVTLLGRSLFDGIMARDRVLGASALLAYAPLRLLLNVWGWMADDPDRWPRVPTPPHSPRDYLPKPAKYTRTVAPTLAHCDAALRHMPERAAPSTRTFALFLRYTGLRSDTILNLRREDIDLADKSLHIRGEIDKNDFDRVIPLADALVDEIRDWLSLMDEGPIFFKRNHTQRKRETPKAPPTKTFHAAWRAATDADEVPEHVWNPPNRKNARPEHGFRAAVDAYLIGAGVRPDVVDYLVGRNESDIRGRHYGREMLDEARRAVNLLPPIDRKGPRGDNVVDLEQRRRTAG